MDMESQKNHVRIISHVDIHNEYVYTVQTVRAVAASTQRSKDGNRFAVNEAYLRHCLTLCRCTIVVITKIQSTMTTL